MSVRLKGTVKWFDPKKLRFGYIMPDDGGSDVFVHLSSVNRIGCLSLQEGQRIEFDIGRRGYKQNACNLVLLNEPLDLPPTEEGTVKFFNQQRGFGFIIPAKGGKDVFVHISALKLANIPTLHGGERMTYRLRPERIRTVAIDLRFA